MMVYLSSRSFNSYTSSSRKTQNAKQTSTLLHIFLICVSKISSLKIQNQPKKIRIQNNHKQTLFMDENARIIGTLKPFTEDKTQRALRQQQVNDI